MPKKIKSKKSALKKTIIKSPKKPVRKISRRKAEPVVYFNRYIVIGTVAVLLFIFAIVLPNKQAINQSVAGVSIMRGIYVQATVNLPDIDGAVSYNIYFKKLSESDFTNAVRNIPAGTTTYTISYLKKGINYQYKIAAVGKNGSEFKFTDSALFSNIQGM